MFQRLSRRRIFRSGSSLLALGLAVAIAFHGAFLAAIAATSSLVMSRSPSVLALMPLAFGRRESNADVMVFRQTTPPTGGVGQATIGIERDPAPLLKVGFFESRLDNAGDQWRSAAWSAIATTSFLLGRDFGHRRFSFEYNGSIDGPSAGGLFTVHVLALALGDKVRADTTMTGTINPDGTIGPVGGIPLKLQGASEAGKRRIAIPAGQLTAEVDAVRQETGLEVFEAANIFDAYRFLTGRPLPLPIGAKDERPQLTPEFYAATTAQVEALQARYRKIEPRKFLGSELGLENEVSDAADIEDGTSPVAFARRGFVSATENFSAAKQSLKDGDLADAYHQTLSALWLAKAVRNLLAVDAVTSSSERVDAPNTNPAVDSNAAIDADRTETSVIASNTDAGAQTKSHRQQRDLIAQAAAHWSKVDSRAEELFARLAGTEARSASDAVNLMRAYGDWIAANGFQKLAQQSLQELESGKLPFNTSTTKTEQALFYSAVAPALADERLQIVEDTLALGFDGTGPVLQRDRVLRFSNTLFQAANASFKAFEALTIQPHAKSTAVAIDVVREEFNTIDATYYLAHAALAATTELAEELDDRTNLPYLQLGGSLLAYLSANSLIAKYYSLKAKFDPELETVGLRVPTEFDNTQGLTSMLDLAEQQARRTIAAARHASSEPGLQILDYDIGRSLREGDAFDKLRALRAFWKARSEANFIAIFSGQFALADRATPLVTVLQWIGGAAAIALAIAGGWWWRSRRRQPHVKS
ncbi:archaeal serine protease [Rubidibacter lacunae KORDI 51-2]|uniref:Archaeal serine protease n=1 Tax=Rubidibacter lacunae KORDI 51-2 TaxID=582515 RepID=U5D675_9CHRO|nr:S16 family serine protease [Rubidibacter lacunae]ERN40133.1 archaeal serine protease [Rubidibacter lacunae KORDI 51-2]